MTLHELFQLLRELSKIYDGHTEIYLSRDAEENQINKVASYEPYGEREVDGETVIVLFPV